MNRSRRPVAKRSTRAASKAPPKASKTSTQNSSSSSDASNHPTSSTVSPKASRTSTSKSTSSPEVSDFSTSSDNIEQVTQEGLHDLFTWNPPPYEEPEKKSITTREPGFFDEHLDDNLVLKNIAHSPNLCQDIEDELRPSKDLQQDI